MQLQYTLTVEDLREVLVWKTGAKKQEKPLVVLLLLLLLFLVCIFGAVPRRLIFGDAFRPYASPEQNLWVTLAPSLCVVSFILQARLLQAWNKRAASRARRATVKAGSRIAIYLSMAWIIPVLWPQLAIHWHPTNGQILCAAFAPWALCFALLV